MDGANGAGDAREGISVQMLARAEAAGAFLKALSHPSRLVILCRLAEGPASVGTLESLLGIPQASVSKQLARLRDEGLVRCERDGRSIIYSLGNARTERIVGALHREFCAGD